VSLVATEVERCREGDRVAAEVLARRATRLALRTAAAILASREEASDVAQDVAVDVLGSLAKLRDPRAFDAWVHRITVRHALRRLRRRSLIGRREISIALLDDANEQAAPDGVDRDVVIAARDALAVALVSLPAKQRIALALRYVHDLSNEEIAAALGCRTGTVHSLLSRARSSLRQDTQLAELLPAFEGG
jgi:RNA polymerase sigma-70 factor, ECF subfamily